MHTILYVLAAEMWRILYFISNISNEIGIYDPCENLRLHSARVRMQREKIYGFLRVICKNEIALMKYIHMRDFDIMKLASYRKFTKIKKYFANHTSVVHKIIPMSVHILKIHDHLYRKLKLFQFRFRCI